MKKISIICLLIMLSTSSYAQDEYTNAVNLRPISTLAGIAGVNFEKMPNEKIGINTDVFIGNIYSLFINQDPNPRNFTLSGTTSLRFHLDQDMESFFLAPFIKFRYHLADGVITKNSEVIDIDTSVQKNFFLGFNFGKRWVWESGYNIVLRAGYGYPIYHNLKFIDKGEDSDNEDIHNDIFQLNNRILKYVLGLDLEFSFGYTF